MNAISVVIPALNEQETIEQVIALAKRHPAVEEVIVVDDKSMDATVRSARDAGARVITSTRLGKGPSMKEGMLAASHEIIAFLDADICTYAGDTIQRLTDPIFKGDADFVKSYFTRQAGRVTELVAKPLLHILYPGFPHFEQPLSGMVAGKRSILSQCTFEDGYGVDIGLLIDMHNMGARIAEVNIGHIENRLQPLEKLSRMSLEVARTLINKAPQTPARNLETFENIKVIREQMEFALREDVKQFKKVAVFDMDNTILRKSFIHTVSKKFNFNKDLIDIVTRYDNPFTRTKHIAKLMRGIHVNELWEVVDGIPVTENLSSLVSALKAKGYITGIISDSYDCVTNHIKNKFGFDFTLANELEFSDSKATGEVKIPSFFLNHDQSICKHMYCKLNALLHILQKYGVALKNSIVIGDGENDICSVRHSGIGISFCATHPMLDALADYTIKEPDFRLLEPILCN
ncbi:MAG: HAD-IB family phosphatase [Saprospiraceae bacterium]|nr:HAD-IB family phosphatase [Saprospiraceae bacterium]